MSNGKNLTDGGVVCGVVWCGVAFLLPKLLLLLQTAAGTHRHNHGVDHFRAWAEFPANLSRCFCKAFAVPQE